jgi:hypothetical protein
MAKASSSTKFRRVDVDELDEENYRDETDAPEGGDEGTTVGQREAEVEGHLLSYPESTKHLLLR